MNISSGIKNLYQLATKRRPKAECNTTAASMGLKYTGHKLPVAYGQMPDYLMDILDSDEGRAELQRVCPGAKYNPWNDSYCIAWAANKAVNREAVKVVKVAFGELIQHVESGGAVVIGGGFLSGGTSGHFVCVVGMEGDNIIIDDPYGSFNDGYKDHFKGNDIPVPVDKFTRLTFGTAKKKTMQFYSRAA